MKPYVEKMDALTYNNYVFWEEDVRAILLERDNWEQNFPVGGQIRGKKFKFSNVLEELLAEEADLIQSQKEQEQTALKIENALTKNPQKKLKDVKCYNCRKMGHYKFNCGVQNVGDKKEDTRKKTSRKKKKKNVENDCTIDVCMSTDAPNTSGWVFDSGASTHFCGDKMLRHDLTP
ncbi:hypothetical protein NPIL_202331 [Nephila pilipes]|uniref:CCHC-type domain-containing protein n=1 Tax=Nephila pilipes TaxID=299642 RepID=A0A8X6ULI0_NEPPI|nr:hypothetical protein NPIL_202331 [Nephila pilipes]